MMKTAYEIFSAGMEISRKLGNLDKDLEKLENQVMEIMCPPNSNNQSDVHNCQIMNMKAEQEHKDKIAEIKFDMWGLSRELEMLKWILKDSE